MLESEEGSHAQDSSFEEDTYVTVQHEDVVDAVADFVKGRIHSHVMCSNFKPKDIAAAVDTAFADEKGSGWERVWGKGR